VARYISHGNKVYHETLRREMEVVVDKPIASMEKLGEGIAEFENAIKLYEDAGAQQRTAAKNSSAPSMLVSSCGSWATACKGSFFFTCRILPIIVMI